MIRLFFVLLMAVAVVVVLLMIARYMFPRQEDEYLGGKPKDHNDRLWMD